MLARAPLPDLGTEALKNRQHIQGHTDVQSWALNPESPAWSLEGNGHWNNAMGSKYHGQVWPIDSHRILEMSEFLAKHFKNQKMALEKKMYRSVASIEKSGNLAIWSPLFNMDGQA